MREIEVGEYIRTKKGVIRKVKTIKTGKRDFSLTQQTLINGKYKIEEIVNHSFEPIDLIEEGDYVNGREVGEWYDYDEDGNDIDGLGILYNEEDNQYLPLNTIEIKSIVTKEQFLNIEYKVVE